MAEPQGQKVRQNWKMTWQGLPPTGTYPRMFDESRRNPSIKFSHVQFRHQPIFIATILKEFAEENYFTICKIQLMANWWFGARWFGILGVFLSSMFFFNHKRIPGIQTSGPQTTNWPFAERCWKRPWKSRDVQFRESLDMYTLTYGLWQIIFLTMETDWVLIPGENNISYSSVFSEFGSLLLQLLIPVVFTEPWYWYIFGSWLLFRRRVSSVALWDFPNKPNKQVVDGVTFSGPLKHGLLK